MAPRRRSLRSVSARALLAAILLLFSTTGDGSDGPRPQVPHVADEVGGTPIPSWLADSFTALPDTSFIELPGGPSGADAYFQGQAGGLKVSLAPSEVRLVQRAAVNPADAGGLGDLSVSIRFAGADPVSPVGESEGAYRVNLFLGADADAWVQGLRGVRSAVYPAVWPGVDAVFRPTYGALKYEFRLEPGADPANIVLEVVGASALRLLPDGSLEIDAPGGTLRDSPPISWQEAREARCAYRLASDTAFGFDCAGLDAGLPLVIDPLLFSTLIGGSMFDSIQSLAVDGEGYVYVAAYSLSPDFPTTVGGLQPNLSGGPEAVVAKLSPDGSSLVFATYLGGSAADFPSALALGPGGSLFVAGSTGSSDFPTTPGAASRNLSGPNTTDAFVARLSQNGSILEYATYLGGSGYDEAAALAVDSCGAAFVAGRTFSTDLPATPGAFMETAPDANSGFVAKLDHSSAALAYLTYLGGSRQDVPRALRLGAGDEAVVAGWTESSDFPTTPGAYSRVVTGGPDVYVTRLTANGSSLIWSTLVGGSRDEAAAALALDGEGNVFVTGNTHSVDFPTSSDAFQSDPGNTGAGGTSDAFALKLAPDGAGLLYSTYLGGGLHEGGTAIAVDSGGNAFVAGEATFSDFWTTPNAYDRSYNGATNASYDGSPDAFLAKLNPTGSGLDYGTYLGGGKSDVPYALALGRDGYVHMGGSTQSSDFPTTNGSFGRTRAGVSDGFLARLEVPAPTLFINAPLNGSNSSVPAVWVSGLTDAGVNLTISGVRVGVANNGSFGLVLALLPGANVILATAVAPDGRTNTASVNVTYVDPVPGLVQQIAQLQASLNATQAALNGTAADLTNTTLALISTRDSLADLWSALNASEQELSAAEANLSGLKALLDAASNELARLQAEASENESVLEATRAALQETQSNLSAAYSLISSLNQGLDRVRADVSASVLEVEYLSGLLDSTRATLDETSARLNATNDSLDRTRSDLGSTRAEVAAVRSTLNTLLALFLTTTFVTSAYLWKIRRKAA